MTEALDPVSGRIDLDRAVAVRPAGLDRGAELADAYVRFMQKLAAIGIEANGMTERRDNRVLVAITCLSRVYPIAGPGPADDRSGERAWAALTDVVDRHLAATPLRLAWFVTALGRDRVTYGVLADPALVERACRAHRYKRAVVPPVHSVPDVAAPAGTASASPSRPPAVDPVTGEIDYDQSVMLDAEELAEGGIADAYGEIASVLRELGVLPRPIRTRLSDIAYSLQFDGQTYAVFSPDLDDEDGQAWGRATYAFFDIVNRQLMPGPRLLYALYGGNDLAGVLLDDIELNRARAALPDRREWPYLPTAYPPHFGAPGFCL